MKMLTLEVPVVRMDGDWKEETQDVEEPMMIGLGRCKICSCAEYQAGGPSRLHCADCGHAASDHEYK